MNAKVGRSAVLVGVGFVVGVAGADAGAGGGAAGRGGAGEVFADSIQRDGSGRCERHAGDVSLLRSEDGGGVVDAGGPDVLGVHAEASGGNQGVQEVGQGGVLSAEIGIELPDEGRIDGCIGTSSGQFPVCHS